MTAQHWHDGIPGAPTPELLQGYARILGELRRRGIVRSANAPAGDYAEWLCWKALGGTLEPNSKKSFDLLDSNGRKVQIKARVVSDPPKPGQVQSSPFRSWDFSHAAFVLLDERTYLVRQASLLPAEVFARGENLARRVDHVNGWCVYMTPAVMNHPSAVDITDALNAAAGANSVPSDRVTTRSAFTSCHPTNARSAKHRGPQCVRVRMVTNAIGGPATTRSSWPPPTTNTDQLTFRQPRRKSSRSSSGAPSPPSP